MKTRMIFPALAAVTLLSACDERAFYFYARAFGHGPGWLPEHDYDSGQEQLDQLNEIAAHERAQEQARRERARDVAGAPPQGQGLPPRPDGGQGNGAANAPDGTGTDSPDSPDSPGTTGDDT